MKQVRYFLEALFLALLMAVFKIMPLDQASATGGWIGRAIGPRLAASRKALRNLEQVMPDLSATEQQKVITGMWDNLGRVMAEYPHLERIGRERVTFETDETVRQLFDNNKPCLMISGHFANWESGGAAMFLQLQKNIDLTYRAPNNPWVDKMLMKARTLGGKLRAYPKSRAGGQDMIRAMKEGRYIGFLIDQKYNEGIAVPFLGRPAMTNPVFVQLGRKFDYPIVPWQVERLGGARFKITIYAPLETNEQSTESIIAQAHQHLERWIRKNPEQWLWLHRRWDSQKLDQMKEAA